MTQEDRLSYADFGAAFVRHAVTAERIGAVIARIAGEEVRVGPIHAGPGGLATATAVGRLSDPIVTVVRDEPLTYRVVLPTRLAVEVNIAGTRHRYDVDASIRLTLSVALVPPLSVCVVPERPTYRDVDIDVHPQGLQARVVGIAGNIDVELRKHTARYLRERIEQDAAEFAVVDLRPLISQAADQLTGD
jgi:hypothetical protein